MLITGEMFESKSSVIWKLEFEISVCDLLGRFWVLVISTQNHRDIMNNTSMLYRLVHLVRRLLRVRGVRHSCVTPFAFGAYVETQASFSRGICHILYEPRVTHNNSLCFKNFTLCTLPWLHLPPASHHHQRPFVNPHQLSPPY